MNEASIPKGSKTATFRLLKDHATNLFVFNLAGWLRHKYKQISLLLSDDDLKSAVTSPEREPDEGARHKIGEQIHELTLTGECRQFQVCGIQSGGFSNVYTVIEKQEMRAFCLKANRTIRDDKTQNENLKTEAEIWLSLGKHPNIVSVDSVFCVNKNLYIVIEHIPGRSLRNLIKKKQVDLSTAVNYAMQICRGMLHAQRQLPGFVHGDIKPGNCLITSDGILKITDFGLARLAGMADGLPENSAAASFRDKKTSLRITRQRGGTPPYMAPEQFVSGRTADIHSDIYSFGISFFELLTGRRPFAGPNYGEQHRFCSPPVEILEEKLIPQALSDLVIECLAKTPSDRPESFAFIKSRLTDYCLKNNLTAIPNEENVLRAAEDLSRRGISFSVLGNMQKSAECFKKALKLKPDSADLWVRKATMHLNLRQFDQAYQCLGKVLSQTSGEAAPPAPEALFCLAHIHEEDGRLEEALNCLDRVLQFSPKHYQALNMKAKILLGQQKYKEAKKYFEKSIAADRFHDEPFYRLAETHMFLGNFKKALDNAQKAAELNKNNMRTTEILGDIYFQLADYVKAVENYKTALRLNDRRINKKFLNACGKLYGSLGFSLDKDLVKTLLSCARSSNGSRPDVVESVAGLLGKNNHNPLLLYFVDDAVCSFLDWRSGDTDTEMLEDCLWKVFRSADKFSLPINPYYSIGKVFYTLGKYDDCIKICDRSLKIQGPDEKMYYYLAACYEMMEEYESARFFYDKTLEINDKCELNQLGRGRVEFKIRRAEKATKEKFRESGRGR